MIGRETREDKERAEAPCEEKQDESQCLLLNFPNFLFMPRFSFICGWKLWEYVIFFRVSYVCFGFN